MSVDVQSLIPSALTQSSMSLSIPLDLSLDDTPVATVAAAIAAFVTANPTACAVPTSEAHIPRRELDGIHRAAYDPSNEKDVQARCTVLKNTISKHPTTKMASPDVLDGIVIMSPSATAIDDAARRRDGIPDHRYSIERMNC